MRGTSIDEDSDELSSDAVWVAEDVRRHSSSPELARFRFRFPEERIRYVARALFAAGFYCLRVDGVANILVVEAPVHQLGLAVGTCLDYDGRYLREPVWPS